MTDVYRTPQCVIRLVDDDPEVLDALEFMLSMEGHLVKKYASPEDFFRNDVSTEPGCLITDIRMSPMDGLAFFTELMKRNYKVPVCFLTAHADVETAVELLKDGAVDFLVKPIAADKLIATVDRALRIDRERRGGIQDTVRWRDRWETLTPREKEILKFVAKGWLNVRIGIELGISHRTVEVHRASAMKKLQAKTPAQVAMILMEIPENEL